MTYLEKLKTDETELKALLFDLLGSVTRCKLCPAYKFCESISKASELECKDVFERFLSLDCNDPRLHDIH